MAYLRSVIQHRGFTSQDAFDVRCEWGLAGVSALQGCRTFIVVDVLSFSTSVSVAAGREVEVVPCRSRDAAADLPLPEGTVVAAARGQGYSLSPASLLTAPRGLVLVLASPNGSTIAAQAAGRGEILAGCLRNRTAVARRAVRLGRPIGIIPAGERWPDGSLRPAYEDLLGAGAIARLLPGSRSPEADAAVAAFEATAGRLHDALLVCSSGRELVEKGFPEDVRLAAELDADALAPQLIGGRFVGQPGGS
jgi:2-phosphosulfolactate phosphatase